VPQSHATPERRLDLGSGAGTYILCLKYWLPVVILVLAAFIVREPASALVVAVLAILLLLVAWLTRRVAFALQGMQAIVTAQEVKLTLPTWGKWLGPSTPLVNVQVARQDIEAVEVTRDAAGFGLARKADLVMKDGGRVPVWRFSQGVRKQWIWRPREGWREQTAATYVQTNPTGVTLQFRLMGALFGFAERLAAALDVRFRNRAATPQEGRTS
jgi:hypothetical protein